MEKLLRLVLNAYGIYNLDSIVAKLRSMLGTDDTDWTPKKFLCDYYRVNTSPYDKNIKLMASIQKTVAEWGYDKSDWLQVVDVDEVFLSITSGGTPDIDKAIFNYLFYKTNNMDRILSKLAERYPNDNPMDVVNNTYVKHSYDNDLEKIYLVGGIM